MPERPRLHRPCCGQLQRCLQRAAGRLVHVRRLHDCGRCQLQRAEHLRHPRLVRGLGPPPRGGRSGSPPAGPGVHGPDRDNVFGFGHVARSVHVHVRHPWVHEPQRVQSYAGGHRGQCPGLVGVHRPCPRLHVAYGPELQQRRQHSWRVHLRRQWLHGPDRDHLHVRGNCEHPDIVRVQHSRLHHTRRQKL